MDDCWDGELGDGSSQTLLPWWRDRDDGSPRQCPLWDEDLLVATVKWQRRGDGKGGRGGDGAMPVLVELPGAGGWWQPWQRYRDIPGAGTTALSQPPHVTAAAIIRCPPGLPPGPCQPFAEQISQVPPLYQASPHLGSSKMWLLSPACPSPSHGMLVPPAEPIQTTPGMNEGAAHPLKIIKIAIKDYLHRSQSINSHSQEARPCYRRFFPGDPSRMMHGSHFRIFFGASPKNNRVFFFCVFSSANPTWGVTPPPAPHGPPQQ